MRLLLICWGLFYLPKTTKVSGWIKIHRKFLDWQWFNKSEAVHLFVYMLLKANHKDGKWQGIDIKRGQFVSSLGNISSATGVSIQTIRTILKKLEKTNEIMLKSTSQFTLVTICKYDSYQDEEEETNKPITNNQQTTNKRLTTNKNEKNNKKDNLIDYPLLLNHINNTLGRQFKVINEKVKGSFKARLKEGYSQEDILKAITNCKASTFHKENNYEYCTPEYFSRSATLDKFSNRTIVTESDAIVAHLKTYANASKTR